MHSTKTNVRRARRLISRASAAMLIVASGCAMQKPNQSTGLFEESGSDEVGATHFAVTSVTPMSEVEGDLQPHFEINEASAMRQIVPVAMQEQQAQSQLNSLRLGVGVSDSLSNNPPANDNRGGSGNSGSGGQRGGGQDTFSNDSSSGGGGNRGGGRGRTAADRMDDSNAPAADDSNTNAPANGRGRGGGRRGGAASDDTNADAPADTGRGAGRRGGRGGDAPTDDATVVPLDATRVAPGDNARRDSGGSLQTSSRGGGSSGNRGGSGSNRRNPSGTMENFVPFPDERVAPPPLLLQSELNGPSGVEAQLKYNLATALIQYVKLLNRYVVDAVHYDGYEAYVVRVQIGLMPLSREAQYDTYVDIAFFPDAADGQKTPKVLPLLTTDSLEGLMQAKSNAETKDLALQLRALFSNVGGGIDAQHVETAIDTIAGQDLNSLLTVGRASDNVLRVRLGAAAQPSGRFVMVPRTYTVPIVLLVPKGASDARTPRLTAVSKTVFVNALTGKIRRSRLHMEQLANLEPIRESYQLFKYPELQSPDAIRQLSEFARAGDYAGFLGMMHNTEKGKDLSVEQIGRLWLEVLSLRASEAVQTVTFPLPAPLEAITPPSQTAVLIDNGQFTLATLSGGSALDRLSLEAELDVTINNGAEPVRLRASSQQMRSPDQRDVTFVFPSLEAAGIELQAGQIKPEQLKLRILPPDPAATSGGESYPVLYARHNR